MTSCSATGCSCSTSPVVPRSATPVAPSACIARPTTLGSGRSIGTGWRCCARVSVDGRGCQTSCRRSSKSGSSPSRSPIPVSVRGGSRPSWRGRGGAGSSSRRTASGAVCTGMGSTRARSDSHWSPANRAPYEPPREPQPEPHIEVERPGELVGFDCFYVGRLRGTAGAIWQLTAIDCYSSYAWAELVVCKQGNPTAAQTSALARRVARELKAAGWQLERVICDNGNEYRGERFHQTIARLGGRVTHIHAGRPQTNGHVEALHKTILDECWRPAFARYLYPRYTALSRELDRYLAYYNTDRIHHGRITQGRIPKDIIYGA